MILEELLQGVSVLQIQGSPQKNVIHIKSSYSYDFETQGPLPKNNSILFVHLGPLLPDDATTYFENNVHMLVIDRAIPSPKGATVIQVLNTHQINGFLCNRLAGVPSQKLVLIGVTGTAGKTSTAFLIDSILRAAGLKTGLLSTSVYRLEDDVLSSDLDPCHLTIPYPDRLQEIFSEAVRRKVTHVTMEVTSQSLFEHVVEGVQFDIGVFTNFSYEHQDFHIDMEHYFQNKVSFFTEVLANSNKKNKFACLNLTHSRIRNLAKHLTNSPVRVVGFGRRPGPNTPFYCRNVKMDAQGIRANMVTPNHVLSIESKLLGSYNLFNIVAAVTVGTCLDISPNAIEKGILDCGRIPARLERIANSLGLQIYFDWTHTIEGYRRVLQNLTQWKGTGRLYTIINLEDVIDPKIRRAIVELCASCADGIYSSLENLTPAQVKELKDHVHQGLQKKQAPWHWYENGMDGLRDCLANAMSGDTVAVLGWPPRLVQDAEPWLREYSKQRG